MTIQTSDFPQADKILQVGKVANAIASGFHTDREIEDYIGLESEGRQGRYYRLAAEIIGLTLNDSNYATLTPMGQEYSTLNSDQSRLEFLGDCLVKTRVFKEAMDYIRQHAPNDQRLKAWFVKFFPGGEGTAIRRYSTFKNYLKDTKLVDQGSAVVLSRKYIGEVAKVNEELLALDKKILSLNKGKVKQPQFKNKSLAYNVDLQKLERANKIHTSLVSGKANYLNQLGFQTYENLHIDLFVKDSEIILYEMKSINESHSNFIQQARKAVSQLHEYQYIYDVNNAKLCLVTNKPVAEYQSWYLDYLADDRNIAYEWTEDFVNFETLPNSKAILGDYFK